MIEVILFDLGGVLVRLTGVPTMLEWTPGDLTEPELWEKWLRSEAVRSFESGTIDHQQFAATIIEEFRLSVSGDEFIAAFETWTDGLFDGVEELLNSLRSHYRLATLSNTNAIHWPKLTTVMGLATLIDTHFPSHESGLLKPDAAAFDNAVKQLGVTPDQILFFDDNDLNVTGARKSGLQAEIATGPESVSNHLGLIS
jgi:HAD superfamily hydrolase (TIGR01509 family)